MHHVPCPCTRRLLTLALSGALLLGVTACGSTPKPLANMPPPIYEAPRPFTPNGPIDSVPGQTPSPSDITAPPAAPEPPTVQTEPAEPRPTEPPPPEA